MKPLRDGEVQSLVDDLQALVGAQLQEAQQFGNELGLAFYHDRTMVWLWFDMNPHSPLILRLQKPPPHRPKQIKPLVLFVRAHLCGRRLQAVTMNSRLGRVVQFDFFEPSGERRCLEVRLFPHGQNLLAWSGEKSLSLLKPKLATEKPNLKADPSEVTNEAHRRFDDLREAWFDEHFEVKKKPGPADVRGQASPTQTEAAKIQKAFDRAILKKTEALDKIRTDVASKSDPRWRQTGEWLKTNGHLGVPEEWRGCVDEDRPLAWNIENCFRIAKDKERKQEGSLARLRTLETEIEELRAKGPERFHAEGLAKALKGRSKGLLENAKARGRRYSLSEDLEASIGRSAADNLALLRRAQPHDLWLHLRDYPGAHAILRRPKGRSIREHELQKIGRWVVLQSLHKNEAELLGTRYDLILAECRYVRPIKGDRLGRVQYQNERLFVVRFE